VARQAFGKDLMDHLADLPRRFERYFFTGVVSLVGVPESTD